VEIPCPTAFNISPSRRSMNSKIVVALIVCSAVIFMVTVGSSLIERKLLFYPTHVTNENRLTPWTKNGVFLDYSRPVVSPKNVWLLLHGNAGQASDRFTRYRVFQQRMLSISLNIQSMEIAKEFHRGIHLTKPPKKHIFF